MRDDHVYNRAWADSQRSEGACSCAFESLDCSHAPRLKSNLELTNNQVRERATRVGLISWNHPCLLLDKMCGAVLTKPLESDRESLAAADAFHVSDRKSAALTCFTSSQKMPTQQKTSRTPIFCVLRSTLRNPSGLPL